MQDSEISDIIAWEETFRVTGFVCGHLVAITLGILGTFLINILSD
jgi:hypothetical protein